MDEIDKKIITLLQDDFPLIEEPYRRIADKVGIRETELIDRLAKLKQHGQIRKMGAVLKHRELGYTANALVAFEIADDKMDEVGRLLAAHPAVTHCYARAACQGWPYNIYAMVHSTSRTDSDELARRLAMSVGALKYTMLYSTREWKKASPHYFQQE